MKFRGQKRYYRSLLTKNHLSKIDFRNPTGWFNMWHHHFDMMGLGDKSPKRRLPHLQAMFRHYEILSCELQESEFQMFAIINDNESSMDGLYVHTKNPHSEFPVKINNGTDICNFKNQHTVTFINELSGFDIRYFVGDDNYCIVFKKNIGIPVIDL